MFVSRNGRAPETTIVLEYINRASDWDFDPDRNQDWGLPERCTVDTPYFHIELLLNRWQPGEGIEYYTITCCIDDELTGCEIAFLLANDGRRVFCPALGRQDNWPVWLAGDLDGMEFRPEGA